LILIDTSLLLAAINEKDSHHANARDLLQEVDSGRWGSALLPDYVLVETVNWLARRRGPKEAKRFAVSLLERKVIQILSCSDHFPRILSIFMEQRGTALSLTDAAIVGLARLGSCRVVATFDSDFRAFKELRVIDRPGMAA
jgi:predicted nucleic acid-binding protein